MSNPLTNLFGGHAGHPYDSPQTTADELRAMSQDRPAGNRMRFFFLFGLIVAAAISRLIPHPPNFVPIGAMALFAGAQFRDRRLAFAVPLLAMVLSDVFIGFTVPAMTAFVYAGFAMIVGIGILIRNRRTPLVIATASLAAAALFFVVVNFGVWVAWEIYPRTPGGLVACYVAAIPYFRNAAAANLFYSTVLFGGFAIAQHFVAVLREKTALAR